MKSLQVILVLCFLILLNCKSNKDILKCAVDKIGSAITDKFMQKFNSNPDSAYDYLNGQQGSVTNAINKCK